MIKLFSLFLLGYALTAGAYVPTVESLFRHGPNPDLAANGVVVSLHIKKMNVSSTGESPQDVSLLKESKAEEFYKIYFTKNGDNLKVSQARFESGSFAETSIDHRVYYPNFSAFTVKGSVEQVEKGIFFSALNSILFNNGSHIVNYLKSLGVPVRLNNDLINREKIEYLASYKRYLALIGRDRNARKTEPNPLRPDDAVARARIDSIMAGPMYVDTKQVKLVRDEGDIAWLVDAGNFRSVLSYRTREIQKMTFKTQAGDLEILCKDYWLANGTHSAPRYFLIKTLSGDQYQVEITNMKHFLERDDDLVRRLNRWDQILKGKNSSEPRPEFLL